MSSFSALLLALIVFFVVIPLGSCVACVVCAGVRKEMMDDAKVLAEDGGPTAVSMATTLAAPEPIEPAPTITVSFATFTPKGTFLDECIDFIITPPPGMDAGADLAERFAKSAMKGEKNMSRVYKVCAEQFRTSPALATCNAHISVPLKKDLGGAEIDARERFYNLDSLTNDNVYMKNCLDMKGDWQGVDKDSSEYQEAVRARARREVEKLQKHLGQ